MPRMSFTEERYQTAGGALPISAGVISKDARTANHLVLTYLYTEFSLVFVSRRNGRNTRHGEDGLDFGFVIGDWTRDA